jgi:hypothetical protein
MKNQQNSNQHVAKQAKQAAWALLFLEPAIVLFVLYMAYGVNMWDAKYNSTDKGIMIAASIVTLFYFVPSIIKSYRIVRSC